ncbi:unnamed protein product [Meganyctiphanes norvegica]|uniref:Uncharacterized protein n=1 Tax=Meganyctiphanes norvegica TaxID=48144 RepID=A0AAV2RQM0_MEGNR
MALLDPVFIGLDNIGSGVTQDAGLVRNKFKTLLSTISSLSLPDLSGSYTVVLPFLLILIVMWVVYDIVAKSGAFDASTSTSRALVSAAMDVWQDDTLGMNTLLSPKSMESYTPILNGLEMAYHKYGNML